MGTVSGKHRTPHGSTPRRTVAVTVALAVVAGVAGAGWYGYEHVLKPGSCRSTVDLKVAAAPEIAPALQQVASRLERRSHATGRRDLRQGRRDLGHSGRRGGRDRCANRRRDHRSEQPNGNIEVPDVWVPDSTSWLSRLQGASTPIKLSGESIASSPVVIAVPQPVAKSLAARSDKPTWSSLLACSRPGLSKSGIVDPNGDASGLSALLAVGGATQSGATGAAAKAAAQAATVGVIRALSSGSSQVRDDLLGRFPRSADATALARRLSVAPLPEQAVLAYNSARPPVPLVGLYVSPAPSALDYPYTPIDLTGTKKAAAAKFQARLGGASWSNLLAQDGSAGRRRHLRHQHADHAEHAGRTAAADRAEPGRGGGRPGAVGVVRGHRSGPDAGRHRRVRLDGHPGAVGRKREP